MNISKILFRFLVGLCFALPAALAVYANGQAELVPQQETPSANVENCNDCHDILRSYWAESEHGKAISNPAFQKAWQEAGQPGECLSCHTTGYDPEAGTWQQDGVACATCHSPIPSNHPDDIMPTDISSRLCGSCHLETHEEWSDSTHAQEDLSCIRCHNPHTTQLRAADAQNLCAACHNDEVHFFEYTIHAQEGVTCMDCHLQVTEVQMGEGHGARHHTFTVEMDSCSKCHTLDMHYPVNKDGTPQILVGEKMSMAMEDALIQPEPNPVSPVGYSLLAGLVGMASGIIIAPWSERWFRRMNKS